MNSTSYLTPEVRYAFQSGSLRNKEFSGDDRAALILMDHAGRARLKSTRMSRPCRSTPTLFLRDSWPTQATGPNPNASCSCASWCSTGTAHSTSPAEISEAVQPLRARLATLEAENAELRAAVQDETKHAGSPNARTRRLT